MNPNKGSIQQNDSVIPDSDEISLTDLFRNLWRQRGLVVAFTIFAVAVVLALQFGKGSISSPVKVEYPVAITFSQGATYPNGTPFSPDDLASSLVLERVISGKKLDLNLSVLASAIDVTYSNSLLYSAEQKLSVLLQNAKTPDDIRDSALESLEQLESRGRRSLTLSLDLDVVGMNADQGKVLVKAIVEKWAQVSIEQGLLNVDISRPVDSFVIPSDGNVIDVYNSASRYLLSLSNAVNRLSTQAGAKGLIVSGKSLGDLRRDITTLDGTEVAPLRAFAYSNSTKLASIDPAIQVRLFARQRLLTLEQERLTKLISSYDSDLSKLSALEGGKIDSGSSGSSGASQGSLQLEQSVIDSLLAMGTKLGAVENRNRLFERRAKAVDDLLALEKEMAILTGGSNKVFEKLNATEILQGALPAIEQRLNSIQKDVDAFFVAYRDISLQSGAQLYSAQAAPQVRGGAKVVVQQLIKYSVLAAVVGLMLGIMVALIRAAMINSSRR